MIADAIHTAARAIVTATRDAQERRALWRKCVFHGLRHLTRTISVDGSDGITYFVSTRDLAIGRAVFGTGGYANRDLRLALDLTAEYGGMSPVGRERSVFIDVGANIGTTSLPALLVHGFGRAVAVEPEADNALLLHMNVVANGLTERVTIVHGAASNQDGPLTLELSPANSGDHRIQVQAAGDGAFREADRTTVTIPGRRLDSILKQADISPSEIGLVWIDVQGHEAQVLEGSTDILTAGVPLVVEYWPYGLNRSGSGNAVLDILSEFYTHFINMGDSASHVAVRPRLEPISELARAAKTVDGTEHTNFLLLKPTR